jgi:hypothetical protein
MAGQPAILPGNRTFFRFYSDFGGSRRRSRRSVNAISAEIRPGKLGFVDHLFSFPNPVNEKAARVVAGVVFAVAVLILATGAYWLLIPLAYGFWARVLTGPTLSPLGALAQKVIAPRLGPSKPVPGPPKRFAQGMGTAFSTVALVLALGIGAHTAAGVVLVLLAIAAGLESIFAVCLGCQVFGLLMRVGAIPEAVCAECADVGLRLRSAEH